MSQQQQDDRIREIDQQILRNQEDISMQILNLQAKDRLIHYLANQTNKINRFTDERESNKQAQQAFTSGKLKQEKKILYLSSNNFLKVSKELAFRMLEKDQTKVMTEKKKLEQQMPKLLTKLEESKPYVHLLDIEVADLYLQYMREKEEDEEND